MSSTYPELIYTSFPQEPLSLDNFQDVTSDMKTIVDTYYSYIADNNLEAASSLFSSHPALNTMIINADKLNQILDGLKAVQRMFTDDIELYINELVHVRGEYSPSTQYNKFDFVEYTVNGVTSCYQCILEPPTNNIPPTNNNYFIKRTVQGEKGDPGTGLTNKNAWNRNTPYVVDDMVAYNNAIWACCINNTNSAPTTSNSNWCLIMSFSSDLLNYSGNSTLGGSTITSVIDELDSKIEYLSGDVSNNYYPKTSIDSLLSRKSDNAHTHSDKANKTIIINITLDLANWKGTSAPYTQVISNNSILSNHIIYYDITNDNSTTLSQMEAFLDGKIIVGSQSAGAIIFKALGTLPTINIPITLRLGE